jgi:hypothetical protein
MDDADAKELKAVVTAGFKELNDKLNEIQLERREERGYQLKQKVEKNVEEIEKLNVWKISTEPTINNLRRVIWAIVTVVFAMIGSAAAYFISQSFGGK